MFGRKTAIKELQAQLKVAEANLAQENAAHNATKQQLGAQITELQRQVREAKAEGVRLNVELTQAEEARDILREGLAELKRELAALQQQQPKPRPPAPERPQKQR